ncbi:MAG: Xaa-Pro peptidase family protein [Actinomycetota bacterium]
MNLERLRAGRFVRLQDAMRRHGTEVCLFFNQANVRYATGTAIMTVYSNSAFVRCTVVPAEGAPILFEHPKSLHISRRIVDDVRPMHAWEFTDDPATEASFWAKEIVGAMRDAGAEGNRLAVDKLGTPAVLALQAEGLQLADTGEITLDAREIKTPEEIELLRHNGEIGTKMLSAFESAIAPGVREQDLLAVLTDTLLRNGGEYLITRACVSGPNTNPWSLEASDRALEEGDVVFADTDAIGVEGYMIDVSRTFLCGDRSATPAQKEAYRAAHGWLAAATELVRPGISFEDYAREVPALPEEYLPQRYEVIAHSAGLDDEGPSIAYAGDPQPNPSRVVQEGMVLCLEVYAGEVGGTDGVKLEDQVLVTANGAEDLVPYPFADTLL